MADLKERRRRWRGPALGGQLQRSARFCFAAHDGGPVHVRYPRKRTLSDTTGMSALCQKRTECTTAVHLHSTTLSARERRRRGLRASSCNNSDVVQMISPLVSIMMGLIK